MLAAREASVRVGEVSWVLDYLDDLESDFSVLHRVDDIYSMPGAKFLRMACRITAYVGVMQARADALMKADETEAEPAQRVTTRDVYAETCPASAPRQDLNGPRVVDGSRASLMADPVFSGLIEMG